MNTAGSRSRAAIDPAHLAALNAGTAAARTLSEALAIDHTLLLLAAVPDAGAQLREQVAKAQHLGILKRMATIGAALAEHLDASEASHLAQHPSDTVRGWVCFLLAARSPQTPATLLSQLQKFADDEHFAVREWAWMAARPLLVTELTTSINLLSAWTDSPSERIRRFASEALRPRGVWAAHISKLKEQPELGEPLLEPLRADTSRYVQDSVANWINDAAKTRPDWALQLCRRWTDENNSDATARIVKRALRSMA